MSHKCSEWILHDSLTSSSDHTPSLLNILQFLKNKILLLAQPVQSLLALLQLPSRLTSFSSHLKSQATATRSLAGSSSTCCPPAPPPILYDFLCWENAPHGHVIPPRPSKCCCSGNGTVSPSPFTHHLQRSSAIFLLSSDPLCWEAVMGTLKADTLLVTLQAAVHQ